MGPNRRGAPLGQITIKITKRCWNMLEVAGQAYQTHYHSISCEILPHFYVKNIFLAQKLTKLEHFKEIPENLIEKSIKVKKKRSTTVCWSHNYNYIEILIQ